MLMFTFLFTLLMLIIFGKLALFAFKATWGLAKILLAIVFLPIILIILFATGFVFLAFPILIIVGIVTLIRTIIKA